MKSCTTKYFHNYLQLLHYNTFFYLETTAADIKWIKYKGKLACQNNFCLYTVANEINNNNYEKPHWPKNMNYNSK